MTDTATLPDLRAWSVDELRQFCDDNGIHRNPRTPVSALRARIVKHIIKQELTSARVTVLMDDPPEPEGRSHEVEQAIRQARLTISHGSYRALIAYIESLEERLAADG